MTTAVLDLAPTDLRHELAPVDLAPGVLVDVEAPAAALVRALAWETARVWAAWAWLDHSAPTAGTLVPTPRRAGERAPAR